MCVRVCVCVCMCVCVCESACECVGRCVPECSMMETNEAVVIGNSDISSTLEKEGHHVISFLRDSVMERGVSL